MSLNVDSARLSDLSPMGWLGLGLCGGGLYAAGNAVVEWFMNSSDPATGLVGGGFLLLIGAVLAYEDATPEVEGNCVNCGDHVVKHSSRNTADGVVEVFASGSPRKATLGPLSVVLQRRTEHWLYCSASCAVDHDRVRLLDPRNVSTEAEEVGEYAD